jgi:hypothetical protein
MNRSSLRASILITVTAGAFLLGSVGVANAATESNYGRNLMTEQERAEHRARIRSLDTEEERYMYRQQIHEEMKKRAAKRGISLPDEPGARGKGLGNPGYGPGFGGGHGRGR